jgi:hypothetical protein
MMMDGVGPEGSRDNVLVGLLSNDPEVRAVACNRVSSRMQGKDAHVSR